MKRLAVAAIAASAALLVITGVAAAGTEALVTNGSDPTTFSKNKQNEPAVAIDANHPNILAAGANDNIDMEACNVGDDNDCPFTTGVGGSGIYFSFDSGKTWTQPTYTGWTARDCYGVVGPDTTCNNDSGHEGRIGTLPWYYENGLVSDGDPAVAFGPVPDAQGNFSWANGSRLYYANLTSNFPFGAGAFRGAEALAVSRTDDPATAALGGAAGKAAWLPPVVVSRQSSTTFMDKEQIWADNAASSPFFGTVYVCSVQVRSNSQGNGLAAPIVIDVSSDGGSTWSHKQLSSAGLNINRPDHSGCTVRTDSQGRAYVLWTEFGLGFPGIGTQVMTTSDNGGHNWSRPQTLFAIADTCTGFDIVILRCVEDGVRGARDDLGPAPSIDIANGAPTGLDATNEIVDSWADGRDGLNGEDVMFSYSPGSARGAPGSWSAPERIQEGAAVGPNPDSRGYYAAPAIAPNGSQVYVTYNAFTTPWRFNTTDPRGLVGVVRQSAVGAGGAPTGFTTIHSGVVGDPRGSSQNNLQAEFLGDYVYTAATNTFAVGVWNDARNAAPCDAINNWRFSLAPDGSPLPTGADRTQKGQEDNRAGYAEAQQEADATPAPPAPNNDCPPGTTSWFGNTDIYSYTTAP
jgi:hypothetical protein